MYTKYDIIIIGAGPGGYPCAIRLSQLGKKVLVIEAKELGGLCLNWGCIPTKALSYAAEMHDQFKKARKMGFKLEVQGIDVSALKKWKESVVTRLRNGVGYLFKQHNIEWKNGFAKVISQYEIECTINGIIEKYKADAIVLATGTDVAALPGLEYDHDTIINTDDALELKAIPKSLLVIGAGASGLEMATIYNRFGSEVSVVEIMDQILPGMEQELCSSLHKILSKNGIRIYTGSRVISAVIKDGMLEVKIKQPDKDFVAQYDKILVTVGRKPAQQAFIGLNLDTDNKGYLAVDACLRTSMETIYAIGDIAGPPLLAHKATKQGIALAEYLGGYHDTIQLGTVPSCVFTIPSLSSVGLTEAQAIEQGYKVKTGTFPYRASGKALAMGEIEGMVKIVGDESGQFLGLHILGADSASLIGEGIIAVDEGLKVSDIADSIHPHPTLTEMIQEAAENFYGKATHIVSK
jgi:dihydrolipoamide dehydrogenase